MWQPASSQAWGQKWAHLSFTSSFTPELAWRAWFIMSCTKGRAVSRLGGGQQGRKGAAGAAAALGWGGGSAQGATAGLPPCPDLHRPPVLGREVQPALSPPAQGPAGWHWSYLDPPHSLLDGRGRGCHLLVHQGPQLLLTHVQALGLQLLREKGTQGSDGVNSTPNHSTGILGQLDSCSVPKHLVSPIGEKCRKWGPKPQPNPLPPTRAQPTLSTWPSWRRPCRGLRTRSGWACCTVCGSCSCPTSSSARAPHSRQASIRPGGESCHGSRRLRTLAGVSTQAPTQADARTRLQAPTLPWSTMRTCETQAGPTYGRQGRWGPGARWHCRG